MVGTSIISSFKLAASNYTRIMYMFPSCRIFIDSNAAVSTNTKNSIGVPRPTTQVTTQVINLASVDYTGVQTAQQALLTDFNSAACGEAPGIFNPFVREGDGG